MREDMGRGKKIGVVLMAAIGAAVVLGTAGFGIRSLYVKRENLLMAYEKQLLPGIVCWGDSLTFGTGGNGVSYPSVMEERLCEDRIYIPVVNMGVGGENTVTIAGRAGAIPFKVKAFTIPAGAAGVEISFEEEEGKPVRPLEQSDAGINPCIINGVEGKLTIEKEEDGSRAYFFTRSVPGESVYVPEGTEVETWASSRFEDYIYVVFMGENHGWGSVQELIEQQQAVLAMQKGRQGEYIVIGLPTGTKEERQDLEEQLQAAYGERFLNIREYLSTQGIYDAKKTPTEDDLERMEKGMIPVSLLSDDIHFNETGYRLIGNYLYERMEKLGYFDEMKEAVSEYG